MFKRLAAIAVLAFGVSGTSAQASTISLTSTPVVGGNFDVVVTATQVFLGRDPLDTLLSYGFGLDLNPLAVSLTSADSGPLFEAPVSLPGVAVFGAAVGFEIAQPIVEPLRLATLHFKLLGAGPATIILTSDLLNPNSGLQFFNDPTSERISGSITVVGPAAAVPEPTTLLLLGSGLVVNTIRRRRRAA